MSLLSSEFTPVIPIHSASDATSQKLKSSSSVGAIPRGSDPRLQDVANLLGLNLPPNALRVLSEAQAAGRLSDLTNSQLAKVPAPATRRTTKAKRTTARSHTQPNLIKFGGTSSYARGVPTPKAVPQPLEAVQYQPPPVKARARRAALAAESKAKEAPSPSVIEQPACNGSWGNRAKSMSLPTLQPAAAAGKAVQSPTEVMVPTPASSAETPRAPTRPSTPSGDHLKSASLPALRQPAPRGSTRAAASLSQVNVIGKLLPRMSGILEAVGAPPKRSNTWVAGDAPARGDTASGSTSTSPLALYEPPFPPTLEVPEAEAFDMELPMIDMIEQPVMEEPTAAHGTEAVPPETGLSTTIRSQPSVSLQTFEDLEALFRQENPYTTIPESVEEDPCAALDRILDLELSQVLQTELEVAQTAPLTRAEIDMSLVPPLITAPTDPIYTTDLERDVEMADPEIDDLLRLAFDLLDESWIGFVNLEGHHPTDTT
ncbi:hypothetical protein EI94DRAFT_1797523 [Lactarius quietus]|nr:hypothetical protein EI94DRAFT_1797523 [Lactarius quietus]